MMNIDIYKRNIHMLDYWLLSMRWVSEGAPVGLGVSSSPALFCLLLTHLYPREDYWAFFGADAPYPRVGFEIPKLHT